MVLTISRCLAMKSILLWEGVFGGREAKEG